MLTQLGKFGNAFKRVLNRKYFFTLIGILVFLLLPYYLYTLLCIQKTEKSLAETAQNCASALNECIIEKVNEAQEIDNCSINEYMHNLEKSLDDINSRGVIEYHVEYKRLFTDFRKEHMCLVVAVIHRQAPWYIDTSKAKVRDLKFRKTFADEVGHLKPKDDLSDSVLGRTLIVGWAFTDKQAFLEERE